METLMELLKKTEEFFKNKKYDNPRLEAEKIFAKALGMDRIMLYANFNKKLSEEDKDNIRKSLLEKNEKMSNDIKSYLDSSIVYLKKHNINEAALISELIFSKILGVERMLLFMHYNKVLGEEDKNKISNYLKKIAIDKLPYQYLVNEQNFYGRNFFVEKGVLIPRYDTECLVEAVIKRINKDSLVLDIGTGTGVIAITIALELPETKVLAVDISKKAIEISKKNKEELKAKNVKIIESNLFSNIEFNKFDVIVSNPPYISNNEVEDLSLDTYIHEPHESLFASCDGLYFYYEISKRATEYLKEDGILAFEIGYKQKKAVIDILKAFNYRNIECIKDLDNHDRVIIARKGKNESQ